MKTYKDTAIYKGIVSTFCLDMSPKSIASMYYKEEMERRYRAIGRARKDRRRKLAAAHALLQLGSRISPSGVSRTDKAAYSYWKANSKGKPINYLGYEEEHRRALKFCGWNEDGVCV